jgi:hypothetical protein
MRSVSRQGLALAIVLGSLSTTACSVAAQRRSAETFTWEGRIASGAMVEVKGVNGPVRAVPASGPAVRVEALRSGRRNDPSEVEIVVLEHSGGVTICAVYPSSMARRNECAPGDEGRIGANNNDVQVEFTVEVPSSANLSARTTNGSVNAEDLSGDVEAYTTNGDVRIDGGRTALARTTNGSVNVDTRGIADVRTTNGRITARMQSLDGSSPLRFSTTNGSITLALPADVNATIEASTTNGAIETDFPITVQGRFGRNRLSGTIGSGGQSIEASTTNGGIRLERGG